MRRFKILADYIDAEITSADISALLNKLAANGINLKNIQYSDALTVRILTTRQDYQQLAIISDKHGATVKRIRNFGIFPVIKKFLKRPILTMFLTIGFLLACYVPSRVFFLRVEGNARVPVKYILEVASECGIDFGAKRRLVRSEQMKNRLLEKIPQLQWAGINTYGCMAVISVREKTHSEEESDANYQVSSIVASRDGIIQGCTVFQGNALCAVGQAVKTGQTLVSGYIDCGLLIKTTRADAEIKALTFRDLEVISPTATAVKGAKQRQTTNYSLRIGKNLIKFYKDSGNLDTTCGKIYAEEYVYLPGGFRLPIAIVRETEIYYDLGREEPTMGETEEWLKAFANNYLKHTMVSGEIISNDTEVISNTGAFTLCGRYICMEMIGQIKYEEIIPKDDTK